MEYGKPSRPLGEIWVDLDIEEMRIIVDRKNDGGGDEDNLAHPGIPMFAEPTDQEGRTAAMADEQGLGRNFVALELV
jgi:hypothetical protein